MFTLQLLHANDLEGGVEALDSAPNFAAIVDALEDEVANTVTISAGDNYIPGPFFSTAADFSMGGTLTDGYARYFTEIVGLDQATVDALLDVGRGAGRVDMAIMNIIGFDASAVGNHEFDPGTGAFAEIIAATDDDGLTVSNVGATFPYLTSNIDFSGDNALGGLFTDQILANTAYNETLADIAAGNTGPAIAPATTIDVNGELIGVVGATTQLIETISSTGGTNEITGGANDMAALAAVIQPQIDALLNSGVNKIILTSHLQQIALEKELAELLSGVDIIIAGGSNTLQADATDDLRDGDTADEAYPFLTTNLDGDPVAIVSTDGEYSYVGRLVVDFDDQGVLIASSIDENVSGAYATDDAGLQNVLASQVILGTQGVEMSEAEEVGNVPDTASTGGFDVYVEGNVLVVEGFYENLTSDITGLHIHNAAAGSNGGVVVGIPFEDNDDGSGSFFGRFTLEAAQLAEFNAGNFYVNLHTTDNPAGELRGQMPDAGGLGDVTPSSQAGVALSTSADIVNDLTDAVQAIVDAADAILFGSHDVFLDGRRGTVRTEESNLGNLSADANLAAAQAADNTVTVSFKNGGGIRAEIGSATDTGTNEGDGALSQLDLQNALRFNNDLTLVTLSAEGFLLMLEHAVADTDTAAGNTPGRFPQIGGFRFSFDETGTAQQLATDVNGDYIVDGTTGLPQVAVAGSRIQTVAIIDPVTGEDIVIVEDGALTDAAPASIRMVTLDFLVENNGDGYPFQELATDIQYLTQDGGTTADASAGNILEEQEALADFMAANFPDEDNAFAQAETDVFNDARIVQLDRNGGIDRILLDEADSALETSVASQLATSGEEGATEVIVTENGQAFVTNGDVDAIDIFDIASGALVRSIDLGSVITDFDGVQSVAVQDGMIAAAISREDSNGNALNGVVAFFDLQGTLLNEVEVGNLPDMVTFTPDGMKVLVANEGEPAGGTNPEGSVSIIDLSGGVAAATVAHADFTAFNGQEAALMAAGVLLEPGVSVAQDVEPEYITVLPGGETAWISLQEANAYAVLDLTTNTITEIRSFGVVDRSQPGFEIDASNRDDAINMQNFDNLFGMRQADAITSFEMGGTTYILTANEGDARDDTEARIGDLVLDPTAFPNAEILQLDENLGRLHVRTDIGDTDGDGDYDELYHYGSRSFTIYDEAGTVVFESGSEFSQLLAEIRPEVFNGQGGEFDNRSDDKGGEPEAIAVGEVNGEMFAFIGLERDNGIMVYNITDPANAVFDSYIGGEVNGNVSPETIQFISGDDSSTGGPQIAVAYEVSGTAAVYDLLSGTAVADGGRVFSDTTAGGNGEDALSGRAGDDTLYGNGGDDTMLGGIGNDDLLGGAGADLLLGQSGDDLIDAAAGDDAVGGGLGNDMVHGGDGNDTLFGRNGDDALHGDAGRDILLGGDGADTLTGGDGNDRLIGGTGADVFAFDLSASAPRAIDLVQDFEDGTDLIDTQGTVAAFAELSVADVNGHAVVQGGGQSIVLLNIAAADITADDFLF